MKFEFYNPVRLLFGPGEVSRTGAEAAKLGKKVLLICYKDYEVLSGAIMKVEESLKASGIEYERCFNVLPNPELKQVEEIIKVCRQKDIDLLIGIGGGSVMDVVKISALGFYHDGNPWEMVIENNDGSRQQKMPDKALPLMLIPTIPATSSEMNSAAVLTNADNHIKGYVGNPLMYPKVSIADPELTVSIPSYLTACGGIDAISHNFEPYFNGTEDCPIQFSLEESLVKTIITLLPRVLADPQNVDLRGHLQWAVLVSHNGWNKTGVPYFSSMHMIAHSLSSRFGLNHGATMALIIPAWMKYVYKSRIDKFALFAGNVFGVDTVDKEEAALEGIDRLENFIASTTVPVRISACRNVNITEKDLELMTEDVVKLGFAADGVMNGNPRLTEEDVFNIYKLAY